MRLLRKGTFMNCDFCEENFCDWAITAAQSRPNSHGLPVNFHVDRSQGKLTNLRVNSQISCYFKNYTNNILLIDPCILLKIQI